MRQPSKALAPHNQASFDKVQQLLTDRAGVAKYRELESAVKGHVSGDPNKPNPAQFIDYLIKLDLLAPAD